MTVIGEAFVAISPEASGFVSKLQAQMAAVDFSSVGALAGAAVAGAFAIGLLKIGVDFEHVRFQIEQETGATGKALEGTFNAVKDVFRSVPASLHDTTTAIDELVRRGVPLGPQLEELAKQELFLAKITKTDLASNVETTTALFAKFGVTLGQQPAALDAIFKAVQKSGLGLQDIIDPLKAGGAALSQFGFSITDAAALIAGLGAAGVNIAPALAGLRLAFGKITKDGGDAKAVLAATIKEFSDGTPKTKAAADAIKLFGTRSGVELVTAIEKGRFNVKALFDDITNGRGGIIATGEATLTLGDRFTLLKNNALAAIQPLASSFSSAFEQLIVASEGPISALADAIGHLGVAAAPVAAMFGGVLLGAFKLVLDLLTPFARGLDAVASVIESIPSPVIFALAAGFIAVNFGLESLIPTLFAFGAAVDFALGPVGLVIGAVTALGVLLGHFGTDAGSAITNTDALAGALFDTTKSATGLTDAVNGATSALDDYLNKQLALKSGGTTQLEILSKFGQTFQSTDKALLSSNASFGKWYSTLRLGQTPTDNQRKAVFALSSTLLDARDRLEANAKQTLLTAVANHTLTQEQASAAVAHTRSSAAVADITGRYTDYIAALQRVGPIIAANEAAQQKTNDVQQAAAGQVRLLQDAVLSGAVTMDKAKDASTQFGLSLDKTKQSIKETTDTLTFVQKGLDAVADSAGPINSWYHRVSTAFTNLANDARNKTGSVRADVKKLQEAVDPTVLVQETIKQAQQIATFSDTILKIVGQFPFAARALLADTNKAESAALAAVLVNNPKMLAAFDSANAQLEVSNTRASAIGVRITQKLLEAGINAGTALPAAAAKAIENDAALSAAAGSLVDRAKKAADEATIRDAPGFAAAMKFLAAKGAAGFHPDLTVNVNHSVGDAVATAQRDIQFQKAMEFLAAKASPSFKPDLTTGVGKAVAEAQQRFHDDHTVERAVGDQSKRTQDAFKPDVAAQAKTQFTAATVTIRNLTELALAAGKKGFDVGVAFDSGLAEGMLAPSDVGSAATSLGDLIEKSIKARLKIKSPSLVARDVGVQVTQGLVVGMKVGQSDLIDAGLATADAVTQGITLGFNDPKAVNDGVRKLQALLSAQIAGAAAGVSAATSAAAQALATFLSSATGALPTAATAISNFLSEQNSAQSTVTQSLKDYHKAFGAYHDDVVKQNKIHGEAVTAYKELTAAAAAYFADQASLPKKATKTQRDELAALKSTYSSALSDFKKLSGEITRGVEGLATDQKAITDAATGLATAQKALHDASDPTTFTKNLDAQTAASRRFAADLSKLVREGFKALAEQLAVAGPTAAGKLADAFAGSAVKARAANAAINQATHYATTYTDEINKLFGAPKVQAAAVNAGTVLGTGIVQGVTKSVTAGVGSTIITLNDKLTTQLRPKVTLDFDTTNAAQLKPVVIAQAPIVSPSTVAAATPKTATTLALDLTVHLEDGEVVHASTTVPIPDGPSLTQRVKAEVHAN